LVESARSQDKLEQIRAAGVVGAGGGGFPTHVKYAAEVEVVIANGAECEPLVRVDQQLMAGEAGQVLDGLLAAMQITTAQRGVVALKAKYKAANAALAEQIEFKGLTGQIELFELDDFYPAGDEFVLVREVLGRVIPEFGLPLAVGAVVSNVATLANVGAAVENSLPVTHRWVTVGGQVGRPATFRVPLGTPFSALLSASDTEMSDSLRLIAGGPMMGKLVSDQQTPVTKTTSMILVLPADHPVIERRTRDARRQVHLTRSACLKCMLCTEVCPRNLLGHRLYPDRLMRNLAAGVAEDLPAFSGAYLCSECGLCAAYSCVMNLDPCTVNHDLKQKLSQANIERPEPAKDTQERVFGSLRRVPSKRLIARLGVADFDLPAPRAEFEHVLSRLVVPLAQHAGAAARPVVSQGQKVSSGALLGEIPDGALGARVHTGLGGKVVEVNSNSVTIEVE
jgi:cobalamin reductase